MNIDLMPADLSTVFFDANAIAHETIFVTLLGNGVTVQHYPMWTDEPTDDWQQVHYQEHLSWSVELGVPLPPDIGGIDFEDPTVRSNWLYEHAQHHELVAQALGII